MGDYPDAVLCPNSPMPPSSTWHGTHTAGIAAADALPYVDRCLGCLACVTACPSGVRYGDLLVPFRARTESRERPLIERLHRRCGRSL